MKQDTGLLFLVKALIIQLHYKESKKDEEAA